MEEPTEASSRMMPQRNPRTRSTRRRSWFCLKREKTNWRFCSRARPPTALTSSCSRRRKWIRPSLKRRRNISTATCRRLRDCRPAPGISDFRGGRCNSRGSSSNARLGNSLLPSLPRTDPSETKRRLQSPNMSVTASRV